MGFEKALGAVKVIKDKIQYRSQSLLNSARGYFTRTKMGMMGKSYNGIDRINFRANAKRFTRKHVIFLSVNSAIRIPSLNLPETRSLGTFWSILSNGYLGNDDRYKNFNFSFHYILSS